MFINVSLIRLHPRSPRDIKAPTVVYTRNYSPESGKAEDSSRGGKRGSFKGSTKS